MTRYPTWLKELQKGEEKLWKLVWKFLDTHRRWDAFFVFIGVLSILSALATLFFFFGDGEATLSARSLPPMGSEEFLQAVESSTRGIPISGGTVTVLNNGDEFFPVLIETIKNAQRSIHITWYIWEEGEISTQINDALLERLDQGVEVRILLDGLSGKMPEDEQEELEKAGAVIDTFRSARLDKLSRFHKRNHRRAVIIDGQIGFTGGMAAADSWLGNAQDPDHWRDMMIKLTGPLARSLESAFGDLWASTTGEIIMTQAMPTADEATGLKSVHVISSPQKDTNILQNFFWLSISAAQQKLYIATPYLVANNAIYESLKERARAGVDVRILLPNRHTDERSAWFAARAHYQELLEDGVKIYEYEPTMLHVKELVADDVWTAIGSANIDFRSMEFNEENIFGFQDPTLASTITADFEKDLTQSRQVTLDEWRHRNVFERLLEFISSKFSKQF